MKLPGHELSEEETRHFCDAWEGRCSGWSRPLKGAAAQAGWDAADRSSRRRGGDMLAALEEWRAHRLAAQAPPSQRVEYAPPRGLPGEHVTARRAHRKMP